jgi:hypothetical protein
MARGEQGSVASTNVYLLDSVLDLQSLGGAAKVCQPSCASWRRNACCELWMAAYAQTHVYLPSQAALQAVLSALGPQRPPSFVFVSTSAPHPQTQSLLAALETELAAQCGHDGSAAVSSQAVPLIGAVAILVNVHHNLVELVSRLRNGATD